jgi:adenosylmethionine-8-amino-7-oxononanoate aminotransferase
VVFAKGVTSGYQPLGGVVVSGRVAEPFWDRPGQVFKHGQTYSGHPVACAAALATIGVLERDGLLERARQTEETLAQVLKSLADHPLVDHVRAGTGVLGALELDDRQLTARPDLPAVLFAAIRERGVLVRPMGSSLGFSPPLTVTDEHLDLMADAVRIGLDSVGVV